ncbi:hypothetical protein [Mariprofundus ferrooxydans]|uniref:hypothetical protein n=1 Tax=Mariprofundus ferrooxydans TaxID=314344 RepID=UPI0014313DA3|nr:hypothetical protein [Mariprofundus ferrooxydans]
MTPRKSNQIVNYTELMQKSIEATLRRQRVFVNALGEAINAPDGLSVEGLLRGDYYGRDGKQLNIETYAWMLTNSRPHLWANMNLKEPDTMQPYEFWGYQLASVNWRGGDYNHKDGAEVGKTREIITKLLWSCETLHNLELLDVHGQPMRRVESVVGAPLQGHLSDIIDAIEEQIELNPHLQTGLRKGWHQKAPYHKITIHHSDGRGIIHFRPGGIAGGAFRGIHVNAWGMLEEAALLKSAKHWSEFKRALKPSATWGTYSVPDGDRDCDFYRRNQSSMPYEEFKKRYPNGWKGPGKPPRVLFNWPKTLMPEPFWSAERRREFIDDFGGEDSPGYQQNVLGQDGDRANCVFPYATMVACLTQINEFRRLKIIANKSEQTITIELYSYEQVDGGDGRENLIYERNEPVPDWNGHEAWRDIAERLVFEAFGHIRDGEHWIGADLGESQDPTEIMVAEDRNSILRRHSSLQLKNVDYHIQCEFIYAIDCLMDRDMKRPAWGIDEGNAGRTVIGILHKEERYQERDFENRIMPIGFGNGFDAVNLEGEQIIDRKSKTEKPLRCNGKELGSDLLLQSMQRRKGQYPYCPEMVNNYTSQVYRQGPRWKSFPNKNDHWVDSDRAMIMNRVLSGSFGGHDAFACGANQR